MPALWISEARMKAPITCSELRESKAARHHIVLQWIQQFGNIGCCRASFFELNEREGLTVTVLQGRNGACAYMYV